MIWFRGPISVCQKAAMGEYFSRWGQRLGESFFGLGHGAGFEVVGADFVNHLSLLRMCGVYRRLPEWDAASVATAQSGGN